MIEHACEMQIEFRRVALPLLVLLLSACAKPPAPVEMAQPKPPPIAAPAPPTKPSASPAPDVPPAAGVLFLPSGWADLPGWRDDTLSDAWRAFIAGCAPLVNRSAWREVCTAASRISAVDTPTVRAFFERHFRPWQIASGERAVEGLITGYYEPLLRGSRTPGGRYRHPLYRVPEDMVSVELGEIYPELKNMRLRGRIEGRRVVPYYDRSQIDGAQAPLRGQELAWVDDAVELFFLHIQGSGRIALDDGRTLRVGYADQNGYPYRSIGRLLVERGELTLDQASMQGIKAWAQANPQRLVELLNSNASYVFFRELPDVGSGPPGSLGVALTPERSIAVDPRFVPLGAPVYVSTTWPNTARPLNRLTLAQDTGGAIRGAVRADFFWGHGEAAAREAGRMKQRLRMWVLLPHGYPVPTAPD